MSDQNEYNRKLIEEFRANRGRSDGPLAGRPLLLLTTTGARSGQQRTTPLMYVRDGDRLLIIASNAGAPAHPDWYRNLVAHPQVVVEVGADTYAASAVVLEGANRQRVWDSIVRQYPFFIDHQAKVTRQIPIVALERRS
jgi:deazaflavin-dependent oxidoreductase (nitroreductase family)